MSKIKNGGLDQYGAERFERQQFGTAGVEGVNPLNSQVACSLDPIKDMGRAKGHYGSRKNNRATVSKITDLLRDVYFVSKQ